MASVTQSLLTGSYIVDPIHSSFGFAVEYQGVSLFRGSFSEVSAKLIDGKLAGTAEVESISIHRPKQFRDHVLGSEFFDAANYPTIECVSSNLDLREDGSAVCTGEMTIKGITRASQAEGYWKAPALDAAGRMRGHLHIQGVVDRRDFGLNWNTVLPSGIAALGHDVTLTIDASLVERTV
jgi:polyisoprenoid-binding protein YceI